MTFRIALLPGLLLTVLAGSAQNNLFSTSTTSPTAKAGVAPQPIEVQAGSGSFSLKDEYALYRGAVRVNDAQFFLSCENLRLNLDMKPAKATQPSATNAVPPLTAPMGGRVRSAEADGGVVFSNKLDASQAFASHAIYQATNDAFVLTGKARIIRSGITTTADRIIYHRAKGDFEAEGNVRTEFVPASTNSAPKKP
jgi:lipopolysaccharide export system protein LptA